MVLVKQLRHFGKELHNRGVKRVTERFSDSVCKKIDNALSNLSILIIN